LALGTVNIGAGTDDTRIATQIRDMKYRPNAFTL